MSSGLMIGLWTAKLLAYSLITFELRCEIVSLGPYLSVVLPSFYLSDIAQPLASTSLHHEAISWLEHSSRPLGIIS